MEFFEFLNKSVSPYHTVNSLKQILDNAEFISCISTDLKESSLEHSKNLYFERGGSLIAVKLPLTISDNSRFKIAVAHTDFPTLKISPNPDKFKVGIHTLHSEIYGSPLYTSWLDRDLGYAGLIAYELEGKIKTKLFRGEKLVHIPELAIHLNRNVNQDGLKINPQTDLEAIWTENSNIKFVDYLQRILPEKAKLLDFDIQLFDAQPAQTGGLNDEWIFSSRLDNLSSCHAIINSFVHSQPSQVDFLVAAFFNNEEVGSKTSEGAEGIFFKSVLEEIYLKSLYSKITNKLNSKNDNVTQKLQNLSNPQLCGFSFTKALSSSFALSIDMAHAGHPCFIQKHEENHTPILGNGIVLKINSQKRYASDVFSCARLKQLCQIADIPYQNFVMRNDMPCGSTVGPAISSMLGIPTVDIGEPMLSMHSIREMTAQKDHDNMIKLLDVFYKDMV